MDRGPVIGAWLSAPVRAGDEGLRPWVPRRIGARLARLHVMGLAAPSDVDAPAPPLEVFLRVGPRDLSVAPLALASLRRHLANPISRIVIATPRASMTSVASMATVAASLGGADGADHVDVRADEDLIDPDVAAALTAAAPAGRESWLRQQFLNLSFVSQHADGPCLVWDADTIMTRRQRLLHESRARMAVSLEHHHAYFTLIRSLLPDVPLPLYTSTVAHHCVFDPVLLRELFDEIEHGPGGRPWWRGVTSRMDRADPSPFADYELYGQWLRARHPDRVDLVAFRNIAMARSRFSAETARSLEARRHLDSVSLHWWYGAET